MENPEIQISDTPKTETEKTEDGKETTIPHTDQKHIVIPVKFNKETRNLTLEEASTLAQKGLKYESIEKDFLTLKELAAKQDKSVPEFLEFMNSRLNEEKAAALAEKCGGNREMAEHILNLEKDKTRDSGFAELKENFPEFSNEDELPDCVRENASLKGTLLLDEYLRYLLNCKKSAQNAEEKQKTAQKSSTGSLSNRSGATSPETEEFLKGLWK